MADANALITPKDQAAKGRRTALLGSLFLMATSAIGPGFITQTGQFTYQMGAAFAFAILVSIIIDIAVQLNLWRVIGVSGMKAQELANSVLPGLGVFLAILVALGGFVFNVGNVAGELAPESWTGLILDRQGCQGLAPIQHRSQAI